jgi:hypothetical protein
MGGDTGRDGAPDPLELDRTVGAAARPLLSHRVREHEVLRGRAARVQAENRRPRFGQTGRGWDRPAPSCCFASTPRAPSRLDGLAFRIVANLTLRPTRSASNDPFVVGRRAADRRSRLAIGASAHRFLPGTAVREGRILRSSIKTWSGALGRRPARSLETWARGRYGNAHRSEARDSQHDQPEDGEEDEHPEAVAPPLRGRGGARARASIGPALAAVGHRVVARRITLAAYGAWWQEAPERCRAAPKPVA